ncbi:MAG: hypothetical protein J6I52_02345 [Prevotella sp.]|nr:hypothetical protein [Prevotella sp.]
MKIVKRLFTCVLLLIVAGVCAGLWLLYGSKTSNPHNYATIGDIPTPWGYDRVSGDDATYGWYLRSLPLKKKGAKVQLFTGGEARFQSLCYAVVDLPLLSNAEQCADVCMRLRAEYLFNTGQYSRIHFKNVNGKTMHYGGGSSRKAFERYLRNVYGVASTFSLSRELEQRRLKDLQLGDVFVYAAADRPGNQKYGHAVMVVDVAQDKHGRKAFLLAEGNTPARDIHVMRNFTNPFRSPWFTLDEDAENLLLSVFHYKASDLKHF